ncbi:MAG: hypothetical protein PHH26_00690 [Candidatus Thermoplasmatota archaeon]|nr:hypothetical protein [Candidatus Thermoplasmatota archaeon]
MKKTLLLSLLLLIGFALPILADEYGMVYHEIQVYDELGRKVTGISGVNIYLPGTTTNAVIYKNRGKQDAITQQITTTSTNTTLSSGSFYWWGADQYDFTITDGTDTFSSGGRSLSASEGKLIFPLFLKDVSTSTYEDDETITMGTDSDWVISGGATANLLKFTPASDGATFRIGLADGTKSANVQIYTASGVGLLIDESGNTLAITGLTTSINASSNYNTNINTGTSTGAVTVGSSTAGAIAFDTTSTFSVNSDSTMAFTATDTTAGNVMTWVTTDGGMAFTAGGAANGDFTVTVGDDLTFATTGLTTITNAGGIVLDGIATQTIIVEGTANDYEATLSFTDPTADVTYTFPVAAQATYSVMLSTLATNAPDIASSVTGGTNQLIFEGSGVDAYEAIITATNPTADIVWTLPDAAAMTVSFMSSTLATNMPGVANSVWGGTGQLIFEGATADGNEAIITVADPTADTIFTLPVMAAGTYSLMSSTLATNGVGIANSVWGGTNQIIMEGSAADANETIITATAPTADRTITIPDKTGQVMLSSAASVIAPSTTPTLTVGLSNIYTDTPTDNENQTITFSGAGTAGDVISIVFICVGTADEVITFQATLVSSTGTLTCDTTAARYYVVTFISDGSHWYEVSRTAVQT